MKAFLILLTLLFVVNTKIHSETGDCAWIHKHIERIPNFPKENISFLSYADLLQNPEAFKKTIKTLADRYRDQGITKIVGLEARGFVFGVALAYEMDKPFVMMRKAGKLPRKTRSIQYGLEYGKDVFELEEESIQETDKVLIVDDVLATGGTASASISLVEELGATVYEVACVFELANLYGRDKVPSEVFSLLSLEE
ncbi:MAG: Adenine phosphoribosyltransferase [Chlamydiae bacterium]|nr:Adenine phosphoribosyltransferase [Chlamydiota bacterium]